ncbi:hypothetical protein DB346_13820 [Verrucomicrobia bacterium LW23]|nr:hypothetical protein DB346_13820 [Verrucomicrobia bacterium LW23]
MERQRYEGNPECDDGLLLYDDGRELVWLYLERENRMMEADSPDLITLARLFREAKLEHIHRQADRVDGRPFRAYSPLFHDLSARSLIKPEAQEMTLEALCTRFIAEREKAHKAHKTQLQTQVGANLLMELFGRHTPANRITRDDAERFCTILETIPLNLRKRYPGLTISDAIEAARKNGETLGACRV